MKLQQHFYYLSSLITLSIDQPDRTGVKNINGPVEVPRGGLLHKGPRGTTTGQTILQNGLTIIIVLAILLALAYLIWGGIQWTTSGGDKNKVHAAQSKIMYAIIGLVVIFLSFFLIQMIGQVFGIDIFGLNVFRCSPGLGGC